MRARPGYLHVGCRLAIACPHSQAVHSQWSADRARGMPPQVSAGYVLRLGCYAFLNSWRTPWAVLPVELLYGLTYGLGTTISVGAHQTQHFIYQACTLYTNLI